MVNRRGNLSLWEWDTSCSFFGFRPPCDKIFSLYCHKMNMIFIEALHSTTKAEAQSQPCCDRNFSLFEHPVLYSDCTTLCFRKEWFLLKLFSWIITLFRCSLFYSLPFDLKLLLSDVLHDSTENGNWRLPFFFIYSYWTTYRRLITIAPILKTNHLFCCDLNC